MFYGAPATITFVTPPPPTVLLVGCCAGLTDMLSVRGGGRGVRRNWSGSHTKKSSTPKCGRIDMSAPLINHKLPFLAGQATTTARPLVQSVLAQ